MPDRSRFPDRFRFLSRTCIAVFLVYCFVGDARSQDIRSTSVELGVKARNHDGVGILIGEVRDGSPAHKAGLKPGDIILALGDKLFVEKPSSRLAFFDAVNSFPPSTAIQVVLLRGKEKLTTYVILVERPSLGISYTGQSGGGYKVRRVREASPASQAGIKVDDVIIGYGDQVPIKNLYEAIDKSPFNVPIKIILLRDGKRMTKKVVFSKPLQKPEMSSEQEYTVAKFGAPDSFSLYITAKHEGSVERVRGEVWNYHDLGKSFTFVNGQLMTSEDIEVIDEGAIFPKYHPWQFNRRMTIEYAMAKYTDLDFVQMVLADELIANGVMYYTEQLSLGFKDDALVFVETIPLLPGGKEESK